jgi:hypothetical protein
MTTATATLEREELLQAVKEIPDDKLAAVLRAVRDILQIDEDESDEPLTEDELAQIAESEADIAAGRLYAWEDVKRELATLP